MTTICREKTGDDMVVIAECDVCEGTPNQIGVIFTEGNLIDAAKKLHESGWRVVMNDKVEDVHICPDCVKALQLTDNSQD